MFRKIFSSNIISSIFWVAFEKFGYSGINFISTIILARILTPNDYGLIAVLAIFISFSQMIVESGLGGALVKKQNVSHQDYDTIFTFNIACSISLYIILFFSAPYIAQFYKDENLINITRVVGLNLIFSALTLTQRVHLIRKLEFRRQSIISICSLLGAVFVSIIVAYKGNGVWALVFQQLIYNIFYFLLIFFAVGYKPKFRFVKESFKELFDYGSKVFLSSLINILYNDGISSLIAKIYSITITGFYYQAKKLVDFPINIFRAFGDNIVFPMLSREEDEIQFVNTSSILMKVILFISLPIFIILYFYSEEIVLLVLGKQWIHSAIMLNILCLSSVGFIIDTVSRNILKATGKGNVILKSEIVKKILALLILFSVLSFDLQVFLYAIVIGNIIGCIVNLYFVNKITLYNIKNQLIDVLPIVFVGIASGLAGKYALRLSPFDENNDLLVGIFIILIFYLSFNLTFFVKPKDLLKITNKKTNI